MFKKILSLILTITMVVSMFCGCNTTQNAQTAQNETTSAVTESNSEYADTVVYGTIWTAEDNDTVEAFAIKGDKFIYVGDKAGATSYIKDGVTKVIDNTGKGLVIPACTEDHGHFVGIDALVRMLPGYFVKYDDLLKILADEMKKDPKPEFFLSWGWDYPKFMNDFDPKRNYAQELEDIAPGIPVFMFDTGGHNAMCNITALKKAGVYNGEKVRGGVVKTTEDGIPNGLIDDEVVFYVIERIIDFSKIDSEIYLEACKNAINTLHKRGFTNYLDAYINALSEKPFYQYLSELDKRDELNINMDACFTVRSYNDKEYKEKIDYVAEMGDKYHTKHFNPYNIKLFADGVVESRTGWMIDEYPDPEKGKEHGNIVWQPEELNEIVKYANSKNILVHTHSFGDGATKAMLDAYINANNSLGKKYRNTLGHVRNITKEDIKRASENGIGIAENLIWHAMDIPNDENYDVAIEMAKSNLPKGIFESGYPMKSLLDAGITVSSSTDAPAAETLEGNIINILSVSTTGVSPDKDNTLPFNPSELLTVREALKCLTINGAKNMGIEDKTGSIKVGKNADFVILDTNFLDYKGDDLKKIYNTKIKAVYFEGKNVLSNVETRETIYRTPEEWKERWKVAEYHPNKEITGDYDKSLAVKCSNGTFVGQTLENNKIKTWRGIPFAKIPARYEKAIEPDKSNKVYEALYFGKSGLQIRNQESEPASFYELGDLDTLTLAIATGNNDLKNKPVFVYVHGGAYCCGGTTDPAYDLRNLAYYYPDIIFIDITYRLGIQGHINLAIKDENGKYVFSDYEDNMGRYCASNNLAILDIIQSLRWIKENIAGFGGDINNITLGGESAGAGFSSTILMMASDPYNTYIYEDENLFQKIYSMSGGINQYASIDDCNILTESLIDYYTEKKGKKPITIKDIQSLSFEEMEEYWIANNGKATFNVLDGIVISKYPFEVYNEWVDDDYIVMQGATTNEYEYFKEVFRNEYEKTGITHEDCARATYKYLTEPTTSQPNLVVTDKFKEYMAAYLKELEDEGYATEDERYNELLNDHYLQTINYYMAQKQAENGGISYCYAFDEPYDGEYAKCRAGHAIDCYYFFGTFTGGKAIGTKEQVDFSRKYQDMAANFIRYGDPSTKDFKWEPYNKETGYITLLNKNEIRCIEKYHKNRIDLAIKMTDENDAMKISFPWIHMFPLAAELHYGK